MKLKPHIFKKDTDSTIASLWNEGVRGRALSLGAVQIQIQSLASFTLEDNADRWWDSLWSDEKKITVSWDEFEAAFDHQFLFEA